MKPSLAVVLGIRPDVIRASLILRELRTQLGAALRFVWSGQHYSDNLKDVFFRQLAVEAPEIELGAKGETDADITSAVIAALYPVLQRLRPSATVFLGDTNTVMGCVAAAQLNIPVVHIEGCMRSYDWRMPEEKYRTVSDHLADVIYTYLEEYKTQGVAEGLNPANVIVVGNPIVDVLNEYYFSRRAHFDRLASTRFFHARELAAREYFLMTCHRRENVEDPLPLQRIMALAGAAANRVYFPASYRTQRMLRESGSAVPANVTIVDPIGYEEFLVLMTNAAGVLTDSGTVVEETCILGVPCVQMRRSTERPQVYDVGACVKFDPTASDGAPQEVYEKLRVVAGRTWTQPFGDGHSSERIAADLVERLSGEDGFRKHQPADYHLDVSRSYRGDGLLAPPTRTDSSAAAVSARER